jgi:hypothetical protein
LIGRQIEFIGYVLISLAIHVVMLVVGKTLLILEAIKNKIFSLKSTPSV